MIFLIHFYYIATQIIHATFIFCCQKIVRILFYVICNIFFVSYMGLLNSKRKNSLSQPIVLIFKIIYRHFFSFYPYRTYRVVFFHVDDYNIQIIFLQHVYVLCSLSDKIIFFHHSSSFLPHIGEKFIKKIDSRAFSISNTDNNFLYPIIESIGVQSFSFSPTSGSCVYQSQSRC